MATAVFPEDLGDSQTGHAVGFTAYNSSIAAQSVGNVLGMTAGGATTLMQQAAQVMGWDNAANFLGQSYIGQPTGQALNNITTPIDSVFLYIPAGGQAPMSWDQKHIYTDVKLARALTNFLGITAAAETAAGMSGMAINPRVEVLFQTTALREFTFTFQMAPQSQQESDAMKSLIKIFRKNAAPTLQQSGYLFNSPKEWGIAFWYKKNGSWVENTNIPKIRRSVLNRVEVAYPVPGGEWSTFSNGHPVSAMLTLNFAEMSIVDSDKIEEGY